jgi:ornithine cyclodeaminase/alanine dehydrogenase-like protein (mu-crystallin family)
MSQPVFLSDDHVAALFDLDTAIASQRRVFEALGRGEAQLAGKVALPGPDGTMALSYVGRLSPEHGVVSKLVSVNPGNADLGLPAIHASIMVLDLAGRLMAVLDATTLTAVRTAAASAVAVDALSRPDSIRLAVLGAGVQAREHIRALSRVRSIETVRIWSPTPANRAKLANEVGAVAVDSPAAAVASADIVVACTMSTEPVVPTEALAPGTTVISVGSFAPERSEVDDGLVRLARVVVDDVPTALGHAGPIMRGVAGGFLRTEDIRSLGDVLLGQAQGRAHAGELVFYNSVGLGVQDAAAAAAVLDKQILGSA